MPDYQPLHLFHDTRSLRLGNETDPTKYLDFVVDSAGDLTVTKSGSANGAISFPGDLSAAAASFTTGAFSSTVTTVGVRVSGGVGIARTATNATIVLAGGTAGSFGGNINLFGGTHSTQASDLELRVGTSVKLRWDHSETKWSFLFGVLAISDVTDTTGVGTGALRVAGGGDFALSLYVGTKISSAFPNTVSGTGLMVTTNDGSVQEIMRDSSSARWKTDIVDAVIDPAKVLGINAKEYGRETQDGRFTGFIVEDFDEAGFKNIIDYDKDGLPTGFLEFGRGITALHHGVLQDHDTRLQEAQHRIEVLETQVELLETAIAEAGS